MMRPGAFFICLVHCSFPAQAQRVLDQTAALRMLEDTPGVIAKTYDQELKAYLSSHLRDLCVLRASLLCDGEIQAGPLVTRIRAGELRPFLRSSSREPGRRPP